MNVDDFKRWVKTAERDQVMIYHTGDLAFDRVSNATLDELASYVYCDAHVRLTQKKLGMSRYEYRASRRGN